MGLNDLLSTQRVQLFGRAAEQLAVDFRIVLAEQRRRLQGNRRIGHLDRPARYRDLPAYGVIDRAEGTSFAQECIVDQLIGVEDRTRWSAGLAERFHDFALRPLGDPRL